MSTLSIFDVITALVILTSAAALAMQLRGKSGRYRCVECGLEIRFRGVSEGGKDRLRQQMTAHVNTHQSQGVSE
ncbi:hypothetical protein OTB20_34385 [Streptomyces sp. H27-H1]|uniref:hypothetical protein n=1 Tax=Streptomyces sp. H27-H1 TaxID=2996461 RepID=UPI00226D6372|nr:hypothetical protein [Streptomyces sp. H27-H1]MCY0931184.1 hypothetical protein [Streptomyces sp. H27-H1]